MYQDYYRFRENPFNVTPDPDFFFFGKTHSEAIDNLLYGIEQRKGMLIVTGEIGTGKTTLCRKILRLSTQQLKFALILNPDCSELQLLQMIVHDLGIEVKSKNKYALLFALNEFLVVESSRGHNVVLIIDEAQHLNVRQLEQVRLLSNLETEKEKLLQIILVGQPELEDKLKLPILRQLRQRVAVRFRILPLSKKDIRHYIYHRITQAAGADEMAQVSFTDQAIESIYQYTQGSPRTINLLCDRALLAGFAANTFSIDADIIQTCAKEIWYCEHYS